MTEGDSDIPPAIRERIETHARENPEAETFEDLPEEVREEIREEIHRAERDHDQQIAEQQLYEFAEGELRTANTDLHRDRPPADS